jgi:uncharacterized protein (DUF927 family)
VPTERDLRDWTSKFQPKLWIVVTGKISGVVVLDFDGEVGRELMAQWNIMPHVRTGSGGFHLYVTHPGFNVPTLNAKAARKTWRWPGLDIRGDGGYAGLLGRNRSGEYVRLRELVPDPWESLPDELREYIRRFAERGTEAQPSSTRTFSKPEIDRVSAGVLVGRALNFARLRGRNNSGMWLAMQLRDNGYSMAEAATVMSEYRSRTGDRNAKGHVEPYTEGEVKATLQQAYARQPREPWRSHKENNSEEIAGHESAANERNGATPSEGRCSERAKSQSDAAEHGGVVNSERTCGEPAEGPAEGQPHDSADRPAGEPAGDTFVIAPGFRLDDRGVFKIGENGDRFVCAPLFITMLARTPEGTEWSKLLEFKDPEGRTQQWLMPLASLAKDSAEYRSELYSRGLEVCGKPQSAALLREYIQGTKPTAYALLLKRMGWHGKTFVLPDNTTFPSEHLEQILLCVDNHHHVRVAGTLDQWRENVSRFCSKNSRLLFSVSCAAAAPLLYIVGEPSGGFHLVGTTSVGKTTCSVVAGSFWGGSDSYLGYAESWAATGAYLESTAEAHNDRLLCLDELKQVDPEHAAYIVYSLANGQGKGRLDRDIRRRDRWQWRLLFLSNGELGLEEHLETLSRKAGMGQRLFAGQEVRFCEIPAEVDEENGAFEFLHGFGSSREFADHLLEAGRSFYGTAARKYLKWITSVDTADLKAAIDDRRRDFVQEYLPSGCSREIARVCQRFGLVAAAGDLMTSAGVTGWASGEAQWGVGQCFKAWHFRRGAGSGDEDRAVKEVARNLFAHGNNRFQLLARPYDADAPQAADMTARVPNRIGFRMELPRGGVEFIIPVNAGTFRELCGPYPEALALRGLKKRGYLVPDDAEHPITPKRPLPELGRPRCYVIREHIFQEGVDRNP